MIWESKTWPWPWKMGNLLLNFLAQIFCCNTIFTKDSFHHFSSSLPLHSAHFNLSEFMLMSQPQYQNKFCNYYAYLLHCHFLLYFIARYVSIHWKAYFIATQGQFPDQYTTVLRKAERQLTSSLLFIVWMLSPSWMNLTWHNRIQPDQLGSNSNQRVPLLTLRQDEDSVWERRIMAQFVDTNILRECSKYGNLYRSWIKLIKNP